MAVVLHATDLASTIDAAGRLGRLLVAGDCLELVGELGAGKTTFTKGICAGRGIAPEHVTSPSFTIVNVYRDPAGGELFHADGFRLGGDLEAETLGLEEASAAIFVVEWPDRLAAVLPAQRLRISFQATDEAEGRDLVLEPVGSRGEELMLAWLEGLTAWDGDVSK